MDVYARVWVSFSESLGAGCISCSALCAWCLPRGYSLCPRVPRRWRRRQHPWVSGVQSAPLGSAVQHVSPQSWAGAGRTSRVGPATSARPSSPSPRSTSVASEQQPRPSSPLTQWLLLFFLESVGPCFSGLSCGLSCLWVCVRVCLGVCLCEVGCVSALCVAHGVCPCGSVCVSDLGSPTVPVCLGLSGFPGHGTSRGKVRKSWTNWAELVPLCPV